MKDMGIKEEIKEEIDDLDERMEEERTKKDGTRMGLVDLLAEKIVSKKLLVWGFATGFLISGIITAEEWTSISLGYVGIQGFADMVTSYKSAGK
jgi:hypothetical protein